MVGKLTGGLAQMAKQRKVTRLTGEAKFVDEHTLQVGDEKLSFNQAIIAVGSRVFKLPDMPWDDERLMDSTDALEMTEIPKSRLISAVALSVWKWPRCIPHLAVKSPWWK